MFYHMDEKAISPNSFLFDEFSPSPNIDKKDILNCQYPPNFDWISAEDPDQGYVKVDFAAPMPPNISKVEACASNGSAMSDYYRFCSICSFFAPFGKI